MKVTGLCLRNNSMKKVIIRLPDQLHMFDKNNENRWRRLMGDWVKVIGA
jgi:hypothetical protein